MDEVTDDRIVAEVVGRLVNAFPGVGREVLVSLVRQGLGAFSNARVRDFLPVLVERRVRQKLRPASIPA